MRRVVGRPVSQVLFDSFPSGVSEQDVISYLEDTSGHVHFGDLDHPPEDFTGFSIHVENCTVDDVRSWGGARIGDYILWAIEYPSEALMRFSDQLYDTLGENYNPESGEMNLSNFQAKINGFQMQHIKNTEFLFYSMGYYMRDEESAIRTLIIGNNGLIDHNLETMAHFFYYIPSLERIVVGGGNNINPEITEMNGAEIIHAPVPCTIEEDVYIPKPRVDVPDGWLEVGSNIPLTVLAPQLVHGMVIPETWYGIPQEGSGLPAWDEEGTTKW